MSERAMRRLGVAACAVIAPVIAVAEPKVELLDLPFRVAEMRGPDSHAVEALASAPSMRSYRLAPDLRLAVVWGPQGGAALVPEATGVRATPLGDAAGELAVAEAAAKGLANTRRRQIGPLTAYFAGQASEYGSGALIARTAASMVRIEERLPAEAGGGARRVPRRTSEVLAGQGAAFEDLEPRIADLDGDGVPEIVTVLTRASSGSALAVIARRGETWSIVAETPPDGKAWLNPGPIADFDGNRAPEIALVRGPHGEGSLEIWDFAGGTLARRASAAGFSTHAAGSGAQDLAAAFDLDRDGTAELVLPSADRKALVILSLSGGKLSERARVPLPAAVASGVAALRAGGATRLVAGLADGRVAVVTP